MFFWSRSATVSLRFPSDYFGTRALDFLAEQTPGAGALERVFNSQVAVNPQQLLKQLLWASLFRSSRPHGGFGVSVEGLGVAVLRGRRVPSGKVVVNEPEAVFRANALAPDYDFVCTL